MSGSEVQRLVYRDQFRSYFGDEFQTWFEILMRECFRAGSFQSVRKTSGDGGLDGFVIDSQEVFQVYAPSRSDHRVDAATASKLVSDFERAFESLGASLKVWTFVHNHPEAKLGKESIRAVASLRAKWPDVAISVLDIDSLWMKLQALPQDSMDRLFGKAAESDPSIQRLLDAHNKAIEQKFDALIHALSHSEGVPLSALKSILFSFKEHELLDSGIETRLLRKVDEYRVLRGRMAYAAEDSFVATRRAEAAASIDEGKFEEADSLLAAAESADVAAAKELSVVLESRLSSAATTRGDRALLAIMQSNYGLAAHHYGEAAKLVAHDERAVFNFTYLQSKSYYDFGSEHADVEALSASIEIKRSLIKGAGVSSAWKALLFKEMGDAESTLGEYAGSMESIDASIKSYDVALKLESENPELRSSILSNQAVSWKIKGEVTDNPFFLQRAIMLLNKALKISFVDEETIRPRAVLHLASATMRLGEITNDATVLADALPLFRRSLNSLGNNKAAFDGVKVNMATVYQQLGHLEGNPTRYIEAITIYCEILGAEPPSPAPHFWISANTNKANAISAFAEAQRDASQFQQAIKCYETSIELASPTAIHLRLEAIYGRARALCGLGDLDREASRFHEALVTIRQAFSLINMETDPALFGRFKEVEAVPLVRLWELTGESHFRDAASIALNEAARTFTLAGRRSDIDRVESNRDAVRAASSSGN